MIGQGRMFGPNREIILHLLDIPSKITELKGLAMELDDCNFNLVRKVVFTSNPEEAFKNIDLPHFVELNRDYMAWKEKIYF